MELLPCARHCWVGNIMMGALTQTCGRRTMSGKCMAVRGKGWKQDRSAMGEGSIAHRYSFLIIINFTLDNSSIQLWNTQGLHTFLWIKSPVLRLPFETLADTAYGLASFGSLHSLSCFVPIVPSLGSALPPLWPFQVPSATSGQESRDFPNCFFSHIPVLELTFSPQHSFQSIFSLSPVCCCCC